MCESYAKGTVVAATGLALDLTLSYALPEIDVFEAVDASGQVVQTGIIANGVMLADVPAYVDVEFGEFLGIWPAPGCAGIGIAGGLGAVSSIDGAAIDTVPYLELGGGVGFSGGGLAVMAHVGETCDPGSFMELQASGGCFSIALVGSESSSPTLQYGMNFVNQSLPALTLCKGFASESAIRLR